MKQTVGKFQKSKLKREIAGKLFEDLTKITFTFKTKTFEVDLTEELLITPDNLSLQIEKIPAIMGYLGSVVAIVERESRDKEDLKKKIEASIDNKIRRDGVVGEARIEKALRRHPNWIDACIEVNRSKEKLEIARSLYVALKIKFEALKIRANDIRNVPGDSIMGVNKKEVIKVTRMSKFDEGNSI